MKENADRPELDQYRQRIDKLIISKNCEKVLLYKTILIATDLHSRLDNASNKSSDFVYYTR